jgi:CheY-like chemotaxis protein
LLTGSRILICEDEPFIALDLAALVEDAGGEVIGPAASVREALDLLRQGPVSGAILDVHLVDRDVTPVAVLLIDGGVPVVIQTGVALPPALRERYPALPVWSKPVRSERMIEHLARRMAEHVAGRPAEPLRAAPPGIPLPVRPLRAGWDRG